MVKIPRTIAARISAIICVISFLVITDAAVFYALPLRYLYPVAASGSGPLPEAAAILFNDFNGNFTGINDETKRRIHHGMSLLREDGVKQLIVVGGNREKSDRKGAQLMADYLFAQGVPADKIRVESGSNDSISNLQNLGKILSGDQTPLGLVSSPYHLLRIRAMGISPGFPISYLPYNPAACSPPLTRSEVWFSAHYNAAAYGAHVLLPEKLYGKIVQWVRKNTEW